MLPSDDQRQQEGKALPSLVQQQLEARRSALDRGETYEMTHEDIQGAAGAIFAGKHPSSEQRTDVLRLCISRTGYGEHN